MKVKFNPASLLRSAAVGFFDGFFPVLLGGEVNYVYDKESREMVSLSVSPIVFGKTLSPIPLYKRD